MPWNSTISRCVCGDYRRELPSDHPLRKNSNWQTHELRPGVGHRTHDGSELHGLNAQTWTGTKKDHPRKLFGIKEWCVLCILHLFNVVWDFMPDMMHQISGTFSNHFIPMLKLKRNPKAEKPPSPNDENGKKYSREVQKNRMAAWTAKNVAKATVNNVTSFFFKSVFFF